MDDRTAAARMLCVGFEGTEPTPDLLDLIDRGVGGVILFSRNITSVEQLHTLTTTLKNRAAPRPLIIAIDHEGGRVMRLPKRFTHVPSMRDVGATDDVELARNIGCVMARELRAVNVDVNFAPVLDVDTNPANPVIGNRSFSRHPAVVARMSVALMQGLQGEGVAACGKHFPGHGDTSLDSHLALPTLPHALERLREVELPPFKAAIDAGVASIMTAHVIFDAVDRTVPATMSKPVIDGLLRRELKFDGLVISDDLEMKAIADHFGVDRAIVASVNAGVDWLLVCHHYDVQRGAIAAIVRAIERGELSRARVDQAVARIERFADAFAKPPSGEDTLAIIGCDEHRAVLRGLTATATTGRDPTDYLTR